MNDTFIDQVEHTEDDNDSDFNPNEFVDELLESTKDEVQFGIISRKEARDLHYDALEMIYPEPTIRLEDDIRKGCFFERLCNHVYNHEPADFLLFECYLYNAFELFNLEKIPQL